MLYNKNITNLEDIISSLNSAIVTVEELGDPDLYYQVGHLLDNVTDQLKTVRLDCQSKTLECCEELDWLMDEVWEDLDKPVAEMWGPEDFRALYDDVAKRGETLVNRYIRLGADPDFLERRMSQFIYELDSAITDDMLRPIDIIREDYDLFPDWDVNDEDILI